MAAAKGNGFGHRDATIAFVAYRNGLRASELVDLRSGRQVDFKTATLHAATVHALESAEPGRKTPTTGIGGGCARTASGRSSAAAAPPRSRPSPHIDGGGAIALGARGSICRRCRGDVAPSDINFTIDSGARWQRPARKVPAWQW